MQDDIAEKLRDFIASLQGGSLGPRVAGIADYLDRALGGLREQYRNRHQTEFPQAPYYNSPLMVEQDDPYEVWRRVQRRLRLDAREQRSNPSPRPPLSWKHQWLENRPPVEDGDPSQDEPLPSGVYEWDQRKFKGVEDEELRLLRQRDAWADHFKGPLWVREGSYPDLFDFLSKTRGF